VELKISDTATGRWGLLELWRENVYRFAICCHECVGLEGATGGAPHTMLSPPLSETSHGDFSVDRVLLIRIRNHDAMPSSHLWVGSFEIAVH
jgi:hypothetical protein